MAIPGIGDVANTAANMAGGAGGAGGDDFGNMIAELKKTYQESMAKSMELRQVQVDQNTQKRVADERVQ